MANEPKADVVKCDVPGCGLAATYRTDGSEKDVHVRRMGSTNSAGEIVEASRDEVLSRPAVPKLNLCERHPNWAHSEDARMFTFRPDYQARK
jgi:hypothetical protein